MWHRSQKNGAAWSLSHLCRNGVRITPGPIPVSYYLPTHLWEYTQPTFANPEHLPPATSSLTPCPCRPLHQPNLAEADSSDAPLNTGTVFSHRAANVLYSTLVTPPPHRAGTRGLQAHCTFGIALHVLQIELIYILVHHGLEVLFTSIVELNGTWK